MAMENFYPVGTIVKLKDEEMYVMIMGHKVQNNDIKESLRDYGGYLYPIGMSVDKQLLAFNEDKIEEIIYQGYINQQHIEYMELIKIAYKLGEYSELDYELKDIHNIDDFKEQSKKGVIPNKELDNNEEIL